MYVSTSVHLFHPHRVAMGPRNVIEMEFDHKKTFQNLEIMAKSVPVREERRKTVRLNSLIN